MTSSWKFKMAGVGMVIISFSGCLHPPQAGGAGNSPVIGAVYAIEGLADAPKVRQQEKAKQQQTTIEQYLDKRSE